MNAGELIAKLSEYPPETIVEVGGEYGMGAITIVDVYSFHKRNREIDGREFVHMSNDLTGYDGRITISNE